MVHQEVISYTSLFTPTFLSPWRHPPPTKPSHAHCPALTTCPSKTNGSYVWTMCCQTRLAQRQSGYRGKRSVGRIASFALQLASEARECCDAVQMHMNLYVPHQALWVTKTWTNNLPKTSLHSGRYHPSHTVLCYPCCFWCHAGPLHPSILLSDYTFDPLRMSPNSQGFVKEGDQNRFRQGLFSVCSPVCMAGHGSPPGGL